MLAALFVSAAVVIANAPMWGTDSAVALDDTVLSSAAKYTIGLQPVEDPGPFPGSVTPTTPTITIAASVTGRAPSTSSSTPRCSRRSPGRWTSTTSTPG
ncbi:hypothetical protein ACFQX6_58420 [Streptosporangium lutulentum]